MVFRLYLRVYNKIVFAGCRLLLLAEKQQTDAIVCLVFLSFPFLFHFNASGLKRVQCECDASGNLRVSAAIGGVSGDFEEPPSEFV